MAAPNTQGFPRELRKRHFSSIDWNFTLILLLSLLLHLVVILFFKSRLTSVIQPETISKIQKRYAKIVLEREEVFPSAPEPLVMRPSEGVEPGDVLFTPVAGLGEGVGVGEGEGIGVGARLSPEERLPEAGAMAAAGRSGGVSGARSMDEISSEVSGVGFLGLLTSGSGYVPESYLNDIESTGRAENQRLGDLLSSLDGVSVARGPEGKGWGTGDGRGGRGGEGEQRVARGSRRQNRAMTVDDLLGALQPTGEVDFDKVDRTRVGYEEVSSSITRRPTAPQSEEEKQRLRRKPEFVQAIINGHRAAITDCYKQSLREDTSLRGKVEVRFAVDPDGLVEWVELLQSTIDHREMIDCILHRIGQWNDFGYGDPTAPPEVYRQVFTFGY